MRFSHAVVAVACSRESPSARRTVIADPTVPPIEPDQVFDAVVLANQLFLASSIDALAALAPEVNLSEYRVLAILDERGAQRLIDLAAALEVTSTTATRIADRLVKHGMVDRVRNSGDRREIHLEIGEDGRRLVRGMAKRRRRLVSSMLAEFPVADQAAALRVLTRLGQGPDWVEGPEEVTETA